MLDELNSTNVVNHSRRSFLSKAGLAVAGVSLTAASIKSQAEAQGLTVTVVSGLGSDVTEAISNADPRDVIVINGRVDIIDEANVIVVDKPIRIIGVPGASIYTDRSVFKVSSDNVTIENIYIYGSNHKNNLFARNNDVAHVDWVISNCHMSGIRVEIGHGVSYVSPSAGDQYSTGLKDNVAIIGCSIRDTINADNGGISVQGANNTVIHDCIIRDHVRDGTSGESNAVGIKVTNFAENTLISKCDIRYCDDDGIDIWQSVNTTIVDSEISYNKEAGIHCHRGYESEGNNTLVRNHVILRNRIQRNDFSGITVYSDNTIIAFNYINENSHFGIHCSAYSFTTPPNMNEDLPTRNVTILNNEIVRNGKGMGKVKNSSGTLTSEYWDDKYRSGIFAYSINGGYIANNKIHRNGGSNKESQGYGIDYLEAENITLYNNSVYNHSGGNYNQP